MLRFGEINFLVSVVLKTQLVYDIVGNIFKLRENLVKFLVPNYFRNLVMVLVNS